MLAPSNNFANLILPEHHPEPSVNVERMVINDQIHTQKLLIVGRQRPCYVVYPEIRTRTPVTREWWTPVETHTAIYGTPAWPGRARENPSRSMFVKMFDHRWGMERACHVGARPVNGGKSREGVRGRTTGRWRVLGGRRFGGRLGGKMRKMDFGFELGCWLPLPRLHRRSNMPHETPTLVEKRHRDKFTQGR